MTRGSIIWGNDELTRAPNTPDAKHIQRDINSACSAGLPAQATRLHGARGKTDHASASMQTGSNTSPGLFASTVAVSRGEETTSQYYPTATHLVGQREGRLSERSPAGRSWAARADWKHAVQGDRLSHSLFSARASLKLAKFAQAVLDVFAGSFWLFYVALWIVVILGILPFTVFCLFFIQF